MRYPLMLAAAGLACGMLMGAGQAGAAPLPVLQGASERAALVETVGNYGRRGYRGRGGYYGGPGYRPRSYWGPYSFYYRYPRPPLYYGVPYWRYYGGPRW